MTDAKTLDILAVGAHPDDVELCCGGTLAKARLLGRRIGIVDLTRGELGTRGNASIRAQEAAEAARILGARRVNLGLPDGGIALSRRNLLNLIRVFRMHRPSILLIPYAEERHPDHVAAHLLARQAWFSSGLRKIATSVNGKRQEPWRPACYFCYMQWQDFDPSVIVDITDVYGTRARAIRAHKSQFYDPLSKEPPTVLSQKSFFEFLDARARLYGWKIGVGYGEPFFTPGDIGVSDLLGLKMFAG